MKKTLKLMLFAVGLMLTPVISSCGDEYDDYWEETVDFVNLPSRAMAFVEEFYPYAEVVRVEKEYDDGEVLYEVKFSNGHEVVFSSDGRWLEVEAPDGRSIPYGIVPLPIQDFLDQYYYDYGVNEINKTGFGYEVELTTGLDMRFDRDGYFIGIDD
ncbi:MAG: PepSY-like domain-containing protein [Bacteroidales bacterium]|nr:PepSY-like domain-containing protein [Bacteroidales bacterium]